MNENKTNDEMSPITGSPIPIDDANKIDLPFIFSAMDEGIFHETTAEVSTNSYLEAVCGNLTAR